MMEILLYLLIGSVSGFFAGLFGIGGGLIIIPCLYFVFHYILHYDPSIIMHLAVGTALASIVISSLSSALSHHKKGAIVWSVVKVFVPFMLIGSLLGAWIANQLSSANMQLVIGLFAFWTAYGMLKKKNIIEAEVMNLPNAWTMRAVGGAIGVASSIFGIAGGSIIVPYLNRCGMLIQRAVATSSACGVPISIMGAIGYLWFGSQHSIQAPNSLGYVHIYAFLGISFASFMTAKLGVKVAHAISAQKLKKYFAIELLLVGCYFIYQWLRALFY